MKKQFNIVFLLLVLTFCILPATALADNGIPERPYQDSGEPLEILGTVTDTGEEETSYQPPVTKPSVSSDIQVYVDGRQVYFADQKPVIQNGRTLLPVRAVTEAMDKIVSYNDGIVVITDSNQNKMTLMIGKKVVTYVKNGATSSSVLDVAPTVLNGRTMLPIRAIAEFFDYRVDWNDATRQLNLTM